MNWYLLAFNICCALLVMAVLAVLAWQPVSPKARATRCIAELEAWYARETCYVCGDFLDEDAVLTLNGGRRHGGCWPSEQRKEARWCSWT